MRTEPKPRSRQDLCRLHLVNVLFAAVTGQDLYLASQIKTAIDLSLAGGPSGSTRAFAAAAAELRRKMDGAETVAPGFHHCDTAAEDAAPGPLWARQAVLDGLKKLAPCREATLLVTGINETAAPARKSPARRRRGEYEETLDLVRRLAASRSRRHANLTLLVI